MGFIEVVERRRLMSTAPAGITFDEVHGILWIDATNGDNHVVVTQKEDGGLDVNVDNTLVFEDLVGHDFDSAHPLDPIPIKEVHISTGNGKDTVEFNSPFNDTHPLTGYISTGNGSDAIIVTGSATVIVDSGNGNDLINTSEATNVSVVG